jgi:hypothetical protein
MSGLSSSAALAAMPAKLTAVNQYGGVTNLQTFDAAIKTAAQPSLLSFSIRQQGYSPSTSNKRSRSHVARIISTM